ncbi:uncharacterized protein LOC119167716 isoform X1 [Rhipicephalus microplus]|uniref:uncharacterized protein LOC119167716 isoform X1 n=1 Tax=Rhipicephalus microplus TaxID=6941 RepID=UPI003F6CE15F
MNTNVHRFIEHLVSRTGFRNTVCCVLPGNVLFEEVVGGLRTVTTSVPFSLKNAASTQLGRISHCCLAVHLRFFLLSERICKNLRSLQPFLRLCLKNGQKQTCDTLAAVK